MKEALRYAYRSLVQLGVDPRKTARFGWRFPLYIRDLMKLRGQRQSAAKTFPFGAFYPCLEDVFLTNGLSNGHYFHQDLLVARRIHANNPTTHVDVGSRIDGFVAHVASFRPIEVIDIRPLSNPIPNVTFVQADVMKSLDEQLHDHCDSLSCLHALEHFGLGRYGEAIKYDGYLDGLQNLKTILKKGGKFYLSVPIGPLRIEFNAHRVFSMTYLLECLAGTYRVDAFSFVDDRGDLHEDVRLVESEIRRNYGCVYGCGIFEMTKL